MPDPPKTPRATRSRSNLAAEKVAEVPKTPRTPGGALSRLKTRSKQNLMGLMKEQKTVQNTPRVKPPVARSAPPLTVSAAPLQTQANTRTGNSSSVEIVPTEGVETIKAYLRIRPPPPVSEMAVPKGKPYLEMQGDSQVIMRAPLDPLRSMASTSKPAQMYSFNKVFGPQTPQSEFFEQTTLPLVENLLMGTSGLLFSYGVSNSGKTYTIQGAGEPSQDGAGRGLIPRTIDVVFNSIDGLQADIPIKPVRQSAVELIRPGLEGLMDAEDTLPEGIAQFETGDRREETSFKVDRNYSYAVFLTYAEVYNEKIFDLLDSIPSKRNTDSPSRNGHVASTPSRGSALPRKNSHQVLSLFGPRLSSVVHGNGAGVNVLKRQALSLKNDPDGGKYIARLRHLRVRSREEAHAIFKMGQLDRQVFGTNLNTQSSRSHGIFTIKVVRLHNGAPEDPDSALVSNLSIVDLAGTERLKNTQNAGDRLKEAANINTSLMTLGQCFETLRANQALLRDRSMAQRRKPALVPYRHSKLTEIFQTFFGGEGRAVMVIHVNPFDTGFEENSHVMRFSAVAREIQTTAFNRVQTQVAKGMEVLRSAVQSRKIRVPVPIVDESGRTKSSVEQVFEIVEEDADDDSDRERDGLVDYLFDQVKMLQVQVRLMVGGQPLLKADRAVVQLMESEIRNATIEAEVRDEVVEAMQQQMQAMQKLFARRLEEASQAHEEKTDKKLDILQRAMTPHHSRIRHSTPPLVALDKSSYSDDSEAEILDGPDDSFASARAESPTPAGTQTRTLLGKQRPQSQTAIVAPVIIIPGISSPERRAFAGSPDGYESVDELALLANGGDVSDGGSDGVDPVDRGFDAESAVDDGSDEDDDETEDSASEESDGEAIDAESSYEVSEQESEYDVSEEEVSEKEIPIKRNRRRTTVKGTGPSSRKGSRKTTASFTTPAKNQGPILDASNFTASRSPLSERSSAKENAIDGLSHRSDASDLIIRTESPAKVSGEGAIAPPSTKTRQAATSE